MRQVQLRVPSQLTQIALLRFIQQTPFPCLCEELQVARNATTHSATTAESLELQAAPENPGLKKRKKKKDEQNLWRG